MSAEQAESEVVSEIVYVSWGGTGRAATLREAMNRAHDSDQGLVYLAILDDSTFADIDDSMLDLAKHELAWLLDAQLELAKQQTGIQDVPVRVLVRAGDVADVITEAVDAIGGASVLIGAPIPAEDASVIPELLSLLGSRLDAPIGLIEP